MKQMMLVKEGTSIVYSLSYGWVAFQLCRTVPYYVIRGLLTELVSSTGEMSWLSPTSCCEGGGLTVKLVGIKSSYVTG